MNIRNAVPGDLDDILELFQLTIKHINKQDYSDEQLKVWGAGAKERQRWLEKIEKQHFLVALEGDEIIGFGSITPEGYLDTMFVDKDRQGQGIAKTILKSLAEFAKNSGVDEIITDASITAQPFFKKFGFEIIKKQTVNKKGIKITNYKMRKTSLG